MIVFIKIQSYHYLSPMIDLCTVCCFLYCYLYDFYYL